MASHDTYWKELAAYLTASWKQNQIGFEEVVGSNMRFPYMAEANEENNSLLIFSKEPHELSNVKLDAMNLSVAKSLLAGFNKHLEMQVHNFLIRGDQMPTTPLVPNNVVATPHKDPLFGSW